MNIKTTQCSIHTSTKWCIRTQDQTIVEMEKSMMHEKGLPITFWAEAVYTAVYLTNRCPTKAVWGKTPFEAWRGREPSLNHLNFGEYMLLPYFEGASIKT